jgi:hypothetical protein
LWWGHGRVAITTDLFVLVSSKIGLEVYTLLCYDPKFMLMLGIAKESGYNVIYKYVQSRICQLVSWGRLILDWATTADGMFVFN